jgi:hypothetical protein
MALVSLCVVSDLSSIMSDYSNEVWFREDDAVDDTDSDDGAHDLVMR